MKVVFTTALACSMAAPAPALLSAQGSDRSAFFLELGGNGLVYSINYEVRFLDQFSGRAGFGFFNVAVYEPDRGVDQDVGVALIPLILNTFIGRGSHQLEIGAGPLNGLAGTGVERGSAFVEMDDLSVAGYTSGIVAATSDARRRPRRAGHAHAVLQRQGPVVGRREPGPVLLTPTGCALYIGLQQQ